MAELLTAALAVLALGEVTAGRVALAVEAALLAGVALLVLAKALLVAETVGATDAPQAARATPTPELRAISSTARRVRRPE